MAAIDCVHSDGTRGVSCPQCEAKAMKARPTDTPAEVAEAAKPKPSYAPVYAAALYPQLAELARKHGYALAVHGSLQRDFDLIAVPWTETVSEPQVLVDAITSGWAAKEVGGPPSDRPHGRRTWSLSIGFGTCAIDLSFMPRSESQLAAQRERDGRALEAIRQRLHCTSYRLGEDIIDIIDAALKDRP